MVHTHEDGFYVDSSDVKACMIVKSHSSVAWGPQQRSCPGLFSHWLLPIKRSDFHLVHGCPFKQFQRNDKKEFHPKASKHFKAKIM